MGLKPACCTRRGSRFAYPNRSRDHLRLSPEAGLRPGAGQKVRTAFTRPERPDGSKNSVFPVYAGSRPNRAIGIKRVPKGIARRQSRTGQGRNGRKGSPLPSSGPSAAPAPISRHRFHLCRAVAMFDSGPSRRRPQTDAIAGSPGRCKGVTESLPAAGAADSPAIQFRRRRYNHAILGQLSQFAALTPSPPNGSALISGVPLLSAEERMIRRELLNAFVLTAALTGVRGGCYSKAD
jgi:hypothetical protein